MEWITGRSAQYDYNTGFPLAEYFSFDVRPFTSLVKFNDGEKILEEGEKPRYLYYMVSGRAKLYITQANGKRTLINFLEAPCFIGEMELLEIQAESNGISALTSCVLYAVDIRECRDQLLNDRKFLQMLCRFLGTKAIGNTGNYAHNQTQPLEVRLAGFILHTAHNRLYTERHTEVSEFLGVTYRHLLYVLAGFVKSGILEKWKQGYYIADLDKLTRIASESV